MGSDEFSRFADSKRGSVGAKMNPQRSKLYQSVSGNSFQPPIQSMNPSPSSQPVFHLSSGPVTGAASTGPVQVIPAQSSQFQLDPIGTKSSLHSSNNTFGYFINTDSAHSNMILPVLPRFN